MKARLSFAWMVVLAALSSSYASSLLNETRIEAFDIEEFINEIRDIQDANQIQSGSFNIRKHRGKKTGVKDSTAQCPDTLRIAAFNIEALGDKKMDNNIVMDIIYKIIILYHVILIQEVRCDDVMLAMFMENLNNMSKYTYENVTSDPLGTTNYCEKYVFLIREDSCITFDKNVDTYQFDKNSKFFERPPFSIRLHYSGITFALMAIHTKPKKAGKEIEQLLENVYPEIKKLAQTNNILIMGDLNAGEGYVSKKKLKELKAIVDVNKKPFIWPLKDDQYTTVCSDKAHDRFIMTQDLKTWMVDGSARVFQFDNESDPNFHPDFRAIAACCVSDHYPIELNLKFKPDDKPKPTSSAPKGGPPPHHRINKTPKSESKTKTKSNTKKPSKG